MKTFKPSVTKITLFLFPFALTCFALCQGGQAVTPPPDGGYPNFTTAEGSNALKNLTTGAANTAVGWFSLFGDTTASFNTGVGAGTLLFNNGDQNTAVGVAALLNNTTGTFNTATGVNALSANTTSVSNTAFGWGALLANTTGSNNTAIGVRAGQNLTGDSNICIGSQVSGVQGENKTIRIGDNLGGEARCHIGGIASTVMTGGYAVVVNPNENQLGILASSARFKKDIGPMDKASEAILSLKPVTFHYKSDDTSTPQFGLIAEEVARTNRALITVDQEGKPFTVRYEQINAMLLNEFLKEHKRVEEQNCRIQQQEATIAELKKEMQVFTNRLKAQDSKIQTVSAQVELTNLPVRTAATKRSRTETD
ncbi:MAG: tail fiber domain-containing protein [Candidatus Udaeobacter sp.]